MDPDSRDALGSAGPVADADPFGALPRLALKQVRLEAKLAQWSNDGRLPRALRWLDDWAGTEIALDRPEVFWRASGLNRPGLVVQLTAPRLGTRLAVGIEIPLAHFIVDRLLGFERQAGESRLQLTPVEWGVWTFLALRALDGLQAHAEPDRTRPSDEDGSLCTSDLRLDRVGPDSFDPEGLGSIVTVRWPVRAGAVAGAVRLWLAEWVVRSWTTYPWFPHVRRSQSIDGAESPASPHDPSERVPRGELASIWRAEAGRVAMPPGLPRLRVGSILPFSGGGLSGTPASPSGPVALVLDLDGQATGFRIPASPLADCGARLLRVENGPIHEPRPRAPAAGTLSQGPNMKELKASQDQGAAPAAAPLDVPVTLTVELGRVNLTLAQLAELKPGDVVELFRHSRAPVDLTSNGRLVARGELIQIDTELGVRVTTVFL